MAMTVNAAVGANNKTVTNSHTTAGGSAPADSYVVVFVGTQAQSGSVTVSSITVGGASLALLKRQTNGGLNIEAWGLKTASALSGNVVVTLSGNSKQFYVSQNYVTEVKSVTPVGATGSHTGNVAGSLYSWSTTMTYGDGCLLSAACNGLNGGILSEGPGQTLLHNETYSSPYGAGFVSEYKLISGGVSSNEKSEWNRYFTWSRIYASVCVEIGYEEPADTFKPKVYFFN